MSLGMEHPDAEVVPQPEVRETKVSLGGLLIGAGIVSVLVIIFVGYSSYMTYKQSYLQAQLTLEQIKALKTAKKYKECVQQARTFLQDYPELHAEVETLLVETLLYECQQSLAEESLAEARKLAEQSRFKDAIALAAQVPEDTELHSVAQQLMSQWSEKIFHIAGNKYQEGNLKDAVAIAGAIPEDSPLAARVKSAIQQWNEEWKKNELHLQAAQKGLDERRWQDAIKAAKKVSNNPYWQKRSEPIIQKAEAEIAASQAATSRRTYKPSSRSVPRSSSTPPSPRSVPRSNSPAPSSNSTVPSSSSTDWRCLNKNSRLPRCRR